MSFFRVGGTEAVQVDVRIVSATHRSLRALVDQGKFRADLLYRLRVVPVYLPPLRNRRADIPLLLERFINELNDRGVRHIAGIHPEAMKLLLDYPWPGNIRELKNVLEYAFAVGAGPELGKNDLPPEFHSLSGEAALQQGSDQLEKAAIVQALAKSKGHVGQAAASLGMSRPTFWRKRKQYRV
jgi:transcriptional regulator with PAS, ATPase and Fis domain